MPGYFEQFTQNTRPTRNPLLRGEGARVWDDAGREFIDFCAQTLNANLGQCHPVITAAMKDQLDRLTCASSRSSSSVAIELSRKLVEITPEPLQKVNLSTATGTLANECAIKAVRKKTGKTLVVSRIDSHLGQSTEMMRISGKHWNCGYLEPRNVEFIPAPNCFRCPYGQKPESCSLECLEPLADVLASKAEQVCGVIMEPIMVDAGVLTPPHKYHRRVRSLCDDHKVPLIWDEVQTGFGWLGVFFAMDYYDIVPDIVTLGKGLSAGFQLSAAIFKPEYDVLTYGEHEMTSGAHPVSCAASLAMIHHLQNSQELARVADKAGLLWAALAQLKSKHHCIGDIRGVGLLAGIEFVSDQYRTPNDRLARAVHDMLVDEGILTRLSKSGNNNNVLQIKPPLVITEDQICRAITSLDSVLSRIGRT